MARRPRPVDPTAGPLQEFAHDLRVLRGKAGNPTYRSLAQKAGFGATTLGEAAGGVRFPSLDVTLAYVGACGGDIAEWEVRWQQVGSSLSSAEKPAADEESAEAQDAELSADPGAAGTAPPAPDRERSRIWSSWRVRLALGGALVIVGGAAVAFSVGGAGHRSAAPLPAKSVNADQTCPTFRTPGAFSAETYLPQTAVRTGPNTSAQLLRNVPAGCWLQVTGYCLGAVILDRNMVGQPLPDERWYELVGGGLTSSAVVHGEPPTGMRPTSCPGAVPAPSALSISIVADPHMPDWAILSAHGTGVRIAGYAADFAPLDAPGTAADWHEIGLPTSGPATASDGFEVPWTFGMAGGAPGGTPMLLVGAACLAGDAPTAVTSAIRVDPSNPSGAKPVTLPAATLAKAASAACAIP